MESVINWLMENYVEVSGAVLGFLYIILSIRQHILTWPTGLLTSALYIYVFFVSKFYADMGLQIYYLVISVYGMYHWLYGGSKGKVDSLSVTRITKEQILWLGLITVILFFAIEYILEEYTDSPVPIGDAFTTALSITATWMLARKIIED